MPIRTCTLASGKKGYKYGATGKCYPTLREALEQMRAMFAAGYKGR